MMRRASFVDEIAMVSHGIGTMWDRGDIFICSRSERSTLYDMIQYFGIDVTMVRLSVSKGLA
jgi:hypothetical protein